MNWIARCVIERKSKFEFVILLCLSPSPTFLFCFLLFFDKNRSLAMGHLGWLPRRKISSLNAHNSLTAQCKGNWQHYFICWRNNRNPYKKIIIKQITNQCLIPKIPTRSREAMDIKSSIPFFNNCNIISIISPSSHSEFKAIYLKFRHCQCDLVSVLWQLQVSNKYAPFIDFVPLQLLL